VILLPILVDVRLAKMKIQAGLHFALIIAMGCVSLAGGSAWAQEKPATQKAYENLIFSVRGPDLFRAHCASCHGLNGKGDGPVAPSLRATVADLTVLAKHNGGTFPEARARRIISGDAPSLLPHGSREMPVWGPIFHQVEEDQDFGNVRLKNLIVYLESIQQK
jgi:mono/diheme cytochrome c family protein